MKEQYGLDVEVDAGENFGGMDEHMRVLLFQAVREILFNVVKHAGILQASVSLTRQNGAGRIRINDTGNGFDAKTIMNDPQAAHGLLIVRDRLNLMGCEMEVRSQPGDGTEIVIEIPAEKSARV